MRVANQATLQELAERIGEEELHALLAFILLLILFLK